MLPSSSRRLLLVFGLACVAIQVPAGPVNINSADAATLARELKGIGLKRAQAIVDYRAKYGPFKSADELALVKGVGKQAIDRNRGDIRVDAAVKAVTKPAVAPTGSAAATSARKPAAVTH
jgi:competence protein ComEA